MVFINSFLVESIKSFEEKLSIICALISKSDAAKYNKKSGVNAPDFRLMNDSLKQGLESIFEELTPREARILKLRFGLEDGKDRTLEEVGNIYNVTRERIRQIEAKALKKLRHPKRLEKLKEYSY